MFILSYKILHQSRRVSRNGNEDINMGDELYSLYVIKDFCTNIILVGVISMSLSSSRLQMILYGTTKTMKPQRRKKGYVVKWEKKCWIAPNLNIFRLKQSYCYENLMLSTESVFFSYFKLRECGRKSPGELLLSSRGNSGRS